jgi:hypothetical protein
MGKLREMRQNSGERRHILAMINLALTIFALRLSWQAGGGQDARNAALFHPPSITQHGR